MALTINVIVFIGMVHLFAKDKGFAPPSVAAVFGLAACMLGMAASQGHRAAKQNLRSTTTLHITKSQADIFSKPSRNMSLSWEMVKKSKRDSCKKIASKSGRLVARRSLVCRNYVKRHQDHQVYRSWPFKRYEEASNVSGLHKTPLLSPKFKKY
eukprot:1048254-Amphidinium_carterae.1